MKKYFAVFLALLLIYWGSMNIAYSNTSNEIYIKVNVTKQELYVIQNKKVIRQMTCSTGTSEYPTPIGTFYIQNKGNWLWVRTFRVGVKYWSSFTKNGQYLIHSVPTDKNGIPNQVSISKLGSPASHGCIRLSVENAKWIYEHITVGTRVVITK